MPVGRNDHAMVWSGTHLFVLGGAGPSGALDDIVRIDPATGEVRTMGAKLPTPRSYVTGAFANGKAYAFGGCNDASQCRVAPTREIVEYDPATDTARVMPQLLPSGRVSAAAVWSGTHVYLFGGDTNGPTGCPNVNEIVRFDPATGEVRVMPTTIPGGLLASAGVWDGRRALLFGGLGSCAVRDTILAYDPATGSLSTLATRLPEPRYWPSAVSIDGIAYVFAGWSSTFLNDVLRFDPASGSISRLPVTFATGRYATAAAAAGNVAFVSGGWNGVARLADVVRFTPPVPPGRPQAPDNFIALGTADKVMLRWDAPASPAPITSYTVYRGTSPLTLARFATTTVPRFDDDGIGLTSRYRYAVSATSANGEGPLSEVRCGAREGALVPCDFSRTYVAGFEATTLPGRGSGNAPGLTVVDDVGDDEFDRWISPGSSIDFEIDMADMASKAQQENAAPYWLHFSAWVRATRSEATGPAFPVDAAEVRVNGQIVGTIAAYSASSVDDYWMLDLAQDATVPVSLVHAGKNRVTVTPIDATSGSPYNGGWQVRLFAAKMELAARPVLIQHGFDPNPFLSNPGVPEWEATMRDWLVSESEGRFAQNPWAWAGEGPDARGEWKTKGIYLHHYSGTNNFRRSANVLHDTIETFRSDLRWRDRIDVVAHSMGGLVARWYIEEGVYEPSSGRIRYGSDVIANVAMVGTPNLGSGWAPKLVAGIDAVPVQGFYYGLDGDPVCAFRVAKVIGRCAFPWQWREWWTPAVSAYRLDGWNYEAHFDLFPEDSNPVISELNNHVPAEGWTGPPNVEYRVIAGFNLFTGGDSVVSGASACMNGRLPCELVLGTEEVPFTGPAWHNGLYTNPDVYARVHRFLLTPDAPVDLADAEDVASWQQTRTASSVVEVGQSWDAALSVDAAPRVAFHALFAGAGAASAVATLVDPTGAIVAATAGEPVPDAGGLALATFTVEAPAAGAWTVRALVPAEAAGNATVIAFGEFPSSLRAELAPQVEPALPAAPAVVRVRIVEDGAPVPNATVRASVFAPGEEDAVEVALADDGLHGDGDAGDGLYGGYYAPLARGVHGVIATATGTSPAGVAFARDLEGGLIVDVPMPARCAADLAQQGAAAGERDVAIARACLEEDAARRVTDAQSEADAAIAQLPPAPEAPMLPG